MTKGIQTIFVSLVTISSLTPVHAQKPDTVVVKSGELRLRGLLWRPSGRGPFPTLIFCHGSYGGSDTSHDPLQQTSLLGSLFARNGYIFLGLFRRGVALSQGQGENSTVLMEKAFKERGQQGRNEVQLQQMETTQLQDMISGMTFLRQRSDVDTNRMGVIGHSFGGSLALLLAEQDHDIKAAVIFSAGGYSWDRSPELRARLLSAAESIDAPVLIVHAQNDYSTNPGYALDSVRTQLNKPHLLKIYPKIGSTASDGHNLLFQSIDTWRAGVLTFLKGTLHL